VPLGDEREIPQVIKGSFGLTDDGGGKSSRSGAKTTVKGLSTSVTERTLSVKQPSSFHRETQYSAGTGREIQIHCGFTAEAARP
jgi:hypothetical protein